ncbi:MAG: DUF4340 domain-containing protein [Desulfobacterales bacterium]
MRAKTFIILLVVLCLLAAAAYFSLSDRSENGRGIVGEAPYASLPVKDIETIAINSSEAVTHLIKKDSLWVVEEKFNFPADFSQIMEMVSGLKTMKIGRSFEASEDAMTRLALHPPNTSGDSENEGVQVVIKNKKGDALLDVVFGKTREMTFGAGGHYILAMPEGMVYLVDSKFDDVGKTPTDWIEKDILDVKAESIQSITCFPIDEKVSVYTLRRPEKGMPPQLTDSPSSMLNPSKIDDVFTALSPLTIEDVAGYDEDPQAADIAYAFAFEYQLFDGRRFRFVPGSGGKGEKQTFFIKIADHHIPDAVKGDFPFSITQILNKWVYRIPEWKFKRFIPDAQELIQKEGVSNGK